MVTRLVPSNPLLLIIAQYLSLLSLLHQPTKTLASFTSSSSSSPSNNVITPGTKLPNIDLHWGFNPVTKVNLPQYTASQSVLIVGTPAAFVISPEVVSSSPSSSSSRRRQRRQQQLPSVFDYLSHQKILRDELDIANVIHYSVNDGAVVGIWNKKILEMFDGENNLVTMMGDPSGAFTKACGMEMTSDDDDEEEEDEFFGASRGFLGRCRPFAMYVVNNVVRCVIVGDDDDGKDVTIDDVVGLIRREREEEMRRQKERQQQERERVY